VPVCRGGKALSTPREPRAFTAALALAATLAAPALAYQLPPVAGVGYPNVPIDRGKKVSAFFGYAYGNDSNVLSEASGSEKADYFQEGLVGLIYATGVPSRSFDFRYEGTFESFQAQTSSSYMEHALRGSIVRRTEATSLTCRASYENLARPVEIEGVGTLGKQRIFVAPDASLRKGQLEFAATGSGALSLYEKDFDYLDHYDFGAGGELRLWRGETKNYFLHFGGGGVEYGPNSTRGYFGYQRLYLGLRGESTARSGYELGFGVQGNDVTGLDPQQEEVFASLRMTRLVQNGRGSLVLGYTTGAEASLLSDYKSVQRVTFRYSYAANTRLSFTAGGTTQNATFANTDDTAIPLAPEDMSSLKWDIGIMYSIGSPQRLHGRFFLSYGTDSRTGPSAYDPGTGPVDYNYDRVRWFGGLALVY
jgi:hypothetical protein